MIEFGISNGKLFPRNTVTMEEMRRKLIGGFKFRKQTDKDLVLSIVKNMEYFSGHLFSADFQHIMEKNLMTDLPIDQCVAAMDFLKSLT